MMMKLHIHFVNGGLIPWSDLNLSRYFKSFNHGAFKNCGILHGHYLRNCPFLKSTAKPKSVLKIGIYMY